MAFCWRWRRPCVRVTVEMLNERGAIEKSTFLAQFRRYKVEDFERLKERWLSEGQG